MDMPTPNNFLLVSLNESNHKSTLDLTLTTFSLFILSGSSKSSSSSSPLLAFLFIVAVSTVLTKKNVIILNTVNAVPMQLRLGYVGFSSLTPKRPNLFYFKYKSQISKPNLYKNKKKEYRATPHEIISPFYLINERFKPRILS